MKGTILGSIPWLNSHQPPLIMIYFNLLKCIKNQINYTMFVLLLLKIFFLLLLNILAFKFIHRIENKTTKFRDLFF